MMSIRNQHEEHHDDQEDHEAEPEPPVDQQPRFTKDDEQRELASLSIDDIFKIQADLMGIDTITGGLSGLGLGNGSTAPTPFPPDTSSSSIAPSITARIISPREQEQLISLEIELAKIPASKKAAYSQATMRCPDEVSDVKRLAFVEHEEGDVSKAALRLIKYWNFRLELFGDDRCYLPMTLLGAMQDEMMNIAERLVWQLLTNTDAAGRGILHCTVSNRNLSQYTMKEEFRAFFYFAHCLMEDDRIRRKGFVQMVDGRHIVRQHFTRKFPRYIEMFDESFPIQMRAVHICYPSNVLFYIIHPVLHRLAPKNVRLRVKMHHGSASEVLQSLSGYSLPPERIHADLGGEVSTDMNQFLMNRMKIEAASLGLKFPTSLCEHAVERDDCEDGRDAKRQKSASPPTSVSPPLSNQICADVDANSQASTIKVKASSNNPQATKRSGPRNVVDPRMARAVQFKKDNPGRPLVDALEAGGFVFVTKAGEKVTDSTRIDQQGVSLKQVRKMLCFGRKKCCKICFSH